ncbi:MAG: hypothetical protein JNM80_11465 [Phycisphaerae bacterium]|nr:hypothetical protein [Phycisphaerae bacterium]
MKRAIRVALVVGAAACGALWTVGCASTDTAQAQGPYPLSMVAGDTLGMAVFRPHAQASAEPTAMPSVEATIR